MIAEVVGGHRGYGMGKQSMGSQRNSGSPDPPPPMPAREVSWHYDKERIMLGQAGNWLLALLMFIHFPG